MSRADAGAERRNWPIESVAPGGDGFLHLSDGRAAFVAGAFPGDVIVPIAIEAKKGHLRATRFELVEPSPHRVAPACPVSETCGGCDWMALDRGEQLVQKAALLRSALERTGHVSDLLSELPMTAAGTELRYRSRVRYHVDGEGRIGFYASKTHALVEVPGCLVAAKELDDVLARLRTVAKESLAAFSEIELRRADEAPGVSVLLVPRVKGGAGPAVKAVKKALPAAVSVSVAGEIAADEPRQRFPLPGAPALAARPGVFTQVNWPVNVALVTAVVEGARERKVARFLDAYAGAGNFSLPLLAAGLRGVSVERDRAAVEDARAAAEGAGLDATGFVVGDAAEELERLARRKERFDLVLLDPPRSGSKDALRSVRRLAPPFVAICACDPVTLARDVATLGGAGYRLDSIHGFDMFPQTHHLEALAWLSRAAKGEP